MGQYYEAYVNAVSTGEGEKIFSPYTMHNGLKIMEHSWWKNDFVNAVAARLIGAPSRVAWIGDYAEPDDCMGVEDCFKQTAMEIIMKTHEVIVGQLDVTEVPPTLEGKFLINHTKKEFVDLSKYHTLCTDADGWCIHPLPLLTAVGNGRGGGDYYSKFGEEYVGKWAFDLIEIDTLPPQLPNTCKGASLMQPEYTEISPIFIERD